MTTKPAGEPAIQVDHRKRGEGPDPIDIHVGSRIRLRRKMLGLSQERLGDRLGLTFQQVQKYERGTNRAGASRLQELSKILDVPIGFFFDDNDPVKTGPVETASYDDPVLSRDAIDLVTAFYRIENIPVRRRLFEVAKAISNASERGAA